MLQFYAEYDAMTLYYNSKKEKKNPMQKKWNKMTSLEIEWTSVFEGMVPVFAHRFCFANRPDSTQCYLEALLEQGWWGEDSPVSPAEPTATQNRCTELSERPSKKGVCSSWCRAARSPVQAQEFGVIICELYSWGTCRLSPRKSYRTLAVL